MPFTDLLRTGWLMSGVSATLLMIVTMIFGSVDLQQEIVILASIWWVFAATGALWVVARHGGRPSRSVERLMADARPLRAYPEPRIGRIVLGRLWPLVLVTLLATVGAALLGAQVSGISAAFPVVWAVLWRAQELAVKAMEDRDGARFYVEPTGPFAPIKLVRGPGLRRDDLKPEVVDPKATRRAT